MMIIITEYTKVTVEFKIKMPTNAKTSILIFSEIVSFNGGRDSAP
jgi:hypothetical protein